MSSGQKKAIPLYLMHGEKWSICLLWHFSFVVCRVISLMWNMCRGSKMLGNAVLASHVSLVTSGCQWAVSRPVWLGHEHVRTGRWIHLYLASWTRVVFSDSCYSFYNVGPNVTAANLHFYADDIVMLPYMCKLFIIRFCFFLHTFHISLALWCLYFNSAPLKAY